MRESLTESYDKWVHVQNTELLAHKSHFFRSYVVSQRFTQPPHEVVNIIFHEMLLDTIFSVILAENLLGKVGDVLAGTNHDTSQVFLTFPMCSIKDNLPFIVTLDINSIEDQIVYINCHRNNLRIIFFVLKSQSYFTYYYSIY